MPRTRGLLTTFLLATAVATGACVERGPYYRSPEPPPRRVDNRAYGNGFADGQERGSEDARRGHRPDYERHNEFRRADRGYDGYGPRDEYRRLFRDGFVAGYQDGYRRSERVEVVPPPPPPPRGPAPGDGRARPREPLGGSPAASVGYRDGFDQGRQDASSHRPFEPVRATRYREGDHDYDSRYGSRDQYKREYRDAFQQGYQAGYRR